MRCFLSGRPARLVLLGLALASVALLACSAFGGDTPSTPSTTNDDAGDATTDSTATGSGEGGDAAVTVHDPCADGGAHRFLFVTHDNFGGDLGKDAGAGRAKGDAICNASAAAVGLPGVYVAWLSTTIDPPRASPRPGVPIVLPRRCEVVADDLAALTATAVSGTLKASPNATEYGETLGSPCYVWTNTTASGTSSAFLATCSDWSSAGAGTTGAVGNCTLTDGQWANWATLACDNGNAHLYCLQN
jgi:hypothetical protein